MDWRVSNWFEGMAIVMQIQEHNDNYTKMLKIFYLSYKMLHTQAAGGDEEQRGTQKN